MKPPDAQNSEFSGSDANSGDLAARVASLEAEAARGHRKAAEALQREQATSEILRIIGTSPGNTQVVFDAIVQSAVELIPGSNAGLYVRDGEILHNVANAASGEIQPLTGREDLPVVVVDLIPGPLRQDDDLANGSADSRRFHEEFGLGSRVMVKLLTHGHPVGLLFVSQRDAFAFTTEHVSLLQTFADQVVIAIENARLFKELEESNREVTAALEQQTAVASVLQTISKSTFDLGVVLIELVAQASRMVHAELAFIRLLGDGGVSRLYVYPPDEQNAEIVEVQAEPSPLESSVLVKRKTLYATVEASIRQARHRMSASTSSGTARIRSP